ncbi:MAG: RNA polymerase sigma factor [Planctomycetaceae bacterium]|nr:RNA polymerase sigma factor [Acidobacteriota bacterium]MCI0359353.1 RNA polymerase sigma factor [Planctomycetaceae bacterium]
MTALEQGRSPAEMDHSRQGQAELFQDYREQLHQFLLAVLRDRAAADDVLQEVFLKLVETWCTLERETIKGWLFTVAYHQALAHRRRRKLHDSALAELWSRPVWQAQVAEQAGEEAIRSESNAAVRRAVQSLPQAQREVVERRMYRDQTFAAIAAELGCPIGTVLTRMRMALKALATLLEE